MAARSDFEDELIELRRSKTKALSATFLPQPEKQLPGRSRHGKSARFSFTHANDRLAQHN